MYPPWARPGCRIYVKCMPLIFYKDINTQADRIVNILLKQLPFIFSPTVTAYTNHVLKPRMFGLRHDLSIFPAVNATRADVITDE